jgi:hypothetical protein
MSVHLEHQRLDKCFAVYIGGDDDYEGQHDAMFSYGVIDGRKIAEHEAYGEAMDYARGVAKKRGELVEVAD